VATRAAQSPGVAGVVPTMYAADVAGDRVPPGSRLIVLNGGGAPINLTVGSPSTLDFEGLTMPDRTIAVANGSFPTGCRVVDLPSAYADPSDGLVALSWSSITSVTFAVTGATRS
jgi:hypothetical protein